MFGRAIEMKLVKERKSNDTEATAPIINTEELVQHVRKLGVDAGKWIAIGVAGYVILDTLRQIAVKSTPEN